MEFLAPFRLCHDVRFLGHEFGGFRPQLGFAGRLLEHRFLAQITCVEKRVPHCSVLLRGSHVTVGWGWTVPRPWVFGLTTNNGGDALRNTLEVAPKALYHFIIPVPRLAGHLSDTFSIEMTT